MTSHRKRVRSLKECDSSGARDGDGDGCTSHVHASSILLSSLARPDWFCGSPSGHAVFDVTFEEIDCASVSITTSLKSERHQARVRNDEVFIVHGEFSLMSSGGSGSGGGDGERLTTPISYRVRDHEINEVVDEAHTNMYVCPSGRIIGSEC